MKISPFACVLAAAFQLSITLADPETSEDAAILSIPIKDVLAKNTAPYEQHPLFKTYTTWISTSEEARSMIENSNNPDVISPSLKGIECYPNDPDCYFASSLDFSNGSDEDWQALVQTFSEAEGAPGKLKRQVATNWKPRFNVNTFNKKKNNKHFFGYDLKCKRLDYRSTGFQLVTFDIVKNTISRPQTAAASAVAKNFNKKPAIQISFRFDFACRKGNGNCCVNDWSAVLDGKGEWSKKPNLKCAAWGKAGTCRN